MFFHRRIGGHLLHIGLAVQVIDLKLCIFHQHRLFRLIIFFYNPQLCFKLVIQKHPPCLGRIRLMLRDMDKEVFDRFIILGDCRLPHDIGTKGKRDAAGISVFIREDLSFPIGPEHHWFCRVKVIPSIVLRGQGGNQIGRKSCTGKQTCIAFPVVGYFHDLEGLFDHLLR